AMIRFLEVGSDRPIHLRRAIARALRVHGSTIGLPILIEELADAAPPEVTGLLDGIEGAAAATVVRTIVDAALIGGHPACTEKRLWEGGEGLRRQRDPAR